MDRNPCPDFMLDRSREFEELRSQTSQSSQKSSTSASSVWPFSPSKKSTTTVADLEKGSPDTLQHEHLYFEEVKVAEAGLDRILKLCSETETLHKKALSEAKVPECIKLAAQIESLVSLITAEGNKLRGLLKKMEAELSNANFHASKSEKAARSSKIKGLCRRFISSMGVFEEMQKKYRRKYEQQMERQYRLVYPDATQDEIHELLHSSQTSLVLSQEIFKMEQNTTAQNRLSDVKERHQEVLAIEKSVQEIHQMILDIAMIIEQHGNKIDRVEDFVLETCEASHLTVDLLKKRVEVEIRRQKRRRMALMLSLTILFILFLIILNELFPNLFPGT